MKITGLILAIIGLIGGVFCLVPFTQPDSPLRDVPGGEAHRPSSAVPLAICGAAVVIGGLMFMYGGKGYYVSNNPDVTN